MKRFPMTVFLILVLVGACIPIGRGMDGTSRESTEDILERLGGYPCPDSDFTCLDVTVPLDHTNPEDKRTIEVVFGILPATGERKGMFVTATGGPGTSGLLSADSYTGAFDPGIPENFDIVFFDQRGVGLSGGLQCPQAAATFYRADWDASTPTGEAALLEIARTFAADCVTEMGNPEILPYMGTEQAVEDLETFRQLMGDDRIWLYGESYGTQYAQTYAENHGDHLAGLILDGTVDLTLSGTDFYVQQAQAFNDVLVETLEACNEDGTCSVVMGGDALNIYDALATQLKESAQTFDFPLPSGSSVEREFTFADLETAAAGFMYSEGARMIFLRALASHALSGDLVALARTLYSSLVLDPETLEAIIDPSYSDAVYYAVECQDYGYFTGSPAERATAYLQAGDEIETTLPRFASIFYGDLPCPFWPDARENPARPEPLVADGIPVLVLNGTTDPATPYSNAQAVYSRLANGYLVTETGGPHIIFGWGNSCVDDLVTAFLVEDELPSQRETVCEGEVVAGFVPLAPLDAADFADPLEALASVDDEIYYLPEYYYWTLETPTSVGCPFGGGLTFEPSDDGESLTLTGCAFSAGFVMTGSGSYNYDEDIFSLDVAVTGLAAGTLTYTRDGDGNLRVVGTYAGETIDLTE